MTLIAVGVVLLLASILWQQDWGFNRGYGEAEALEYTQASAELHAAIHAAAHEEGAADDGHDHAAPGNAALEAAQARYNAAEAKRYGAIVRQETTSQSLKWAAVLILVAGGVAAVVQRGKSVDG